MQTLSKKLPKHWGLTGTNSDRFEVCLDQTTMHNGKPSLLIQSKTAGEEDYAYFYQLTHCTEWIGKRLRVSAYFKTEAVEGHAVISVNLQTQSGEIVVYDAMIDRSLKGDNDWCRVETVFDVPVDCRFLYFGPALWGRGKMWVAEFTVEPVARSVRRTDNHGTHALLALHPINLDFGDGLPPSAKSTTFETAHGWRYDDADSALYEYKLIPDAYKGKPAITIRSKTHLEPLIDDASPNCGYVTQTFCAMPYRGKKIKFSAQIKTENCNDMSGLVLMVLGPFCKWKSIATMFNDCLSGTSDWQEINRVLNVPETAYGISIWLQLNGGGKSYYSDVKVEEAAASEPVTDKGPGLNNLDFLETE